MPMGFWRTRSHRLRARRSDSPRAPSAPRPWLFVGVAALAAGAALIGAPGCKRGSSPPAPAAPVPPLRIYALGGAAGAVEPCGAVKDMLGGADHAAASLSTPRMSGEPSLWAGPGPM